MARRGNGSSRKVRLITFVEHEELVMSIRLLSKAFRRGFVPTRAAVDMRRCGSARQWSTSRHEETSTGSQPAGASDWLSCQQPADKALLCGTTAVVGTS